MTDEELVALVTHEPHNEEAAFFLLYERYKPLMVALSVSILKDNTLYEDLITSVYIALKGRDGDWTPLAAFRGESRFACWIKSVACHAAQKYFHTMIEDRDDTDSIDIEDEDGKSTFVLPDAGNEEYERRQQRILLLEAINELKNQDDRFCVIKHLEGYNSTEIAQLLQIKWNKEGKKHYNNKKELVIPTHAYVDVRFARAKAELKKNNVNTVITDEDNTRNISIIRRGKSLATATRCSAALSYGASRRNGKHIIDDG